MEPDPLVARTLAEMCLAARGSWRGSRTRLWIEFQRRLPADHPAASHVMAAMRAAVACRPLLHEYGCAFYRGGRDRPCRVELLTA